MGGPHLAAGRVYDHARTVCVEFLHRGLFEDRGAAKLGSRCHGTRVIQRMEMKLLIAEQSIVVAIAVQTLGHPFPWPEFPLLIEVFNEKVAGPVQRIRVVEPGDVEPAVDDRVAVHPVVLNTPAHQGHCLVGQLVELTGQVHADPGDEALGRQGIAAADEPAVTARCPPTHLPSLQHHDIGAAFAQAQRRGEPGEAAAHHAYLGVHMGAQGGPRRIRR